MANYGGNSFPFTSAETSAERLPIWEIIDEQMPVGAFMKPEDGAEVGTFWPLGTPIQIEEEGGKPKLGADATKPDGLTRDNVTMGEEGCTFGIVTKGVIRGNLCQATITEAQKEYLKERINFGKEYVVKTS